MNLRNPRLNKSLTLLELIISLVLISLIVLGFASLDLYARYNVQQADRRAKVQNTLSYVLDHMTKNISKAIGDKTNLPVTRSDTLIVIRVDIDINDGTSNGKLDLDTDKQIAYSYNGSTYELSYCDNYSTASYVVIAKNILSNFSSTYVIYDTTDPSNIKNYIDIKIIGRWKMPDAASQANPEITMHTRIKMPAVSTN